MVAFTYLLMCGDRLMEHTDGHFSEGTCLAEGLSLMNNLAEKLSLLQD